MIARVIATTQPWLESLFPLDREKPKICSYSEEMWVRVTLYILICNLRLFKVIRILVLFNHWSKLVVFLRNVGAGGILPEMKTIFFGLT